MYRDRVADNGIGGRPPGDGSGYVELAHALRAQPLRCREHLQGSDRRLAARLPDDGSTLDRTCQRARVILLKGRPARQSDRETGLVLKWNWSLSSDPLDRGFLAASTLIVNGLKKSVFDRPFMHPTCGC